jgi:hypothetical protein
MYIESVPNRASPPAILLRESYRDGGKVKKRTLLNLSDWPRERIAGFKMLLKGGTVIPQDQNSITIIRSLPHGHVTAALGTARKIGLDRLLGPDGNRCRDLILALVVNRILDPGSKLAAARALSPDTATSSLGQQLGLGVVGEDELYCALDWLAVRQPAIEAALAKRHFTGGTWCSTTCRRAIWKAAAVRSPSSATAATASVANCRSSTVYRAPPTAVRWRSRCSPAAPPTRRPSPAK